MNHELATFYGWVRRTRAGLLDWLDGLPPDVFHRHDDRFAFGSLSAIQAHVAATYLKWVGTVGLGREPRPIQDVVDVTQLRDVFRSVDAAVDRGLHTMTDWDAHREWTQPDGEVVTISPRWLILHTITHEFHHKGQSLALARVLGYPHPGIPDTDLVYP